MFRYRQADDTLCAIHRDHIEPIHTFLNSLHPNIKWTKELEVNRRITMLDVTIIRQSDGNLQSDVYCKPTHTNQYINFNSHQPLQHKLSTINSLTRRAALIPSTDKLRAAELARVEEALELNEYSLWAYQLGRYRPKPDPIPNGPTNMDPSSTSNPPSTRTIVTVPPRIRTIATVLLPFHQGMTGPIAQALRKANIHTYIASRGSLRKCLVRPKDKLPHMKSSGNVYHAACAGKEGKPCPARCIGETERSMDTRFH
jgi:hypothetical protein